MLRLLVPPGVSAGSAALVVLDVAVAVLVTALSARGIARWLWNPRRAELRKYETLRSEGLVQWVDHGVRRVVLLSGFSLYAALRADLPWLWAALAIFHFLIAVLAAAMSGYMRSNPSVVPQRVLGPATPEQLRLRVSAGWRWMPVRLVIVLLWVYSWRGLIGG